MWSNSCVTKLIDSSMAKSSGGVRGGGSSANKNFTASVAVRNAHGETRWLSKDFRTQKQAEAWHESVLSRFDPLHNRTASAESELLEHREKSGYMDIIGGRDFDREVERRMRKADRDYSFYKRDKQNYENYRNYLKEAAKQRRQKRRR